MFSSCSIVYHHRPAVLASLRQAARGGQLGQVQNLGETLHRIGRLSQPPADECDDESGNQAIKGAAQDISRVMDADIDTSDSYSTRYHKRGEEEQTWYPQLSKRYSIHNSWSLLQRCNCKREHAKEKHANDSK